MIEKIRNNPRLKQFVIGLISPHRHPRPRLWVRWFVNPFVHKKGRGALIRRHARLDVFPWRRFEVGRDALIEDYAVVNNGAGDVVIGDQARIGIGSVIIGPVRLGDLAYHSMQAREELQKQNGREPKLSEIAARVGQSPENVAMALESAVTPTSLYEPVYSDGEDSFALLDQLRDATGEESWISDMMFRDTVRALTPRERRIIALRYLNGKTQTQVAKEIGISQAQVSRLEKAALNHIKEQICAN